MEDMKSFTQFNEEAAKVTRSGGYLGYELSHASRTHLLDKFKPKFPKVICEHVTYKMPAKAGDDMPPPVHEAHVVGYAEGDGIEALVVKINGTTIRPSDGRLFHITLSLDPTKKKPFHSNELLSQSGYTQVTPVAIELEPKQFF
jgi:hypothetical protein